MLNCLITGGAGFIGSHLAEELITKGNSVCAIDNLSTGRLENVKHLLSSKRFAFVNGSVLDRSLMKKLVEESDVIYHLAAAVGVKYIIENPLKAIQTNVHGTEAVLELASERKQKVMIASSSEVYGKDGGVPYKENGDRLMGATTISRWSYACTKALDEFTALAYFRERELPVVIARFFNTCGPRQTGQYGMVIPRFVRNALLGKPIVVYGDGSQTRCFTFVGDAVRAVSALMEADRAIGEVFNVGSIQEIEIRELARKVIELTGSSSRIEFMSYKEAYGEGFEDMKRRVPDITKIRNLIGWYPEVDLGELLQEVIKYERSASGLEYESTKLQVAV
jgi:UDP-glucose 4-epimerase